ncbi:MAG: Ig-like domain-containing protein [Deltaproteobacteria bacterium]|nr:Ig-like domain-containing protein [Deltaproteobacteria bacterium]
MNSAAWPLVVTCGLFAILATCGFVGCGCGDDDDDSGGGGDDDVSDDDADDDATDDDAVDDDSDDDASDGPTVLDISPPDGATDLRLLTVVEVTFSEPMDAASVEGLFDTGGVAGAFTWDASGEILTFTPDDALDEDTTYNFAIGAGALSLDGDAMADSTLFGFSTVDLWTRTANGADDNQDRGMEVATDADGSAWVCGIETSTTELQNMWFGVWDASGDPMWSETYNNDLDSNDVAWGIAPTGDGGFVVVGSEPTGGPDTLASIRRYDEFSGEEWDIVFDGGDDGSNRAHDVRLGGDGFIYVGGFIVESMEGLNAWVGKYDADGDEDWFESWDGGDALDDGIRAVTVDRDGNVIAAGFTTITGESENVLVRKFDPDGAEIWTRTYNNPDVGINEQAYGVDVDADGNIYVTGHETVGAADTDIWVRKYDPDGEILWTESWGGGADSQDRGNDVAVGPNGEIYVVGFVISTATSADIFIRRMDPADGSEIWTDTVDVDNGSTEEANAVAVDSAGNVYVAGSIPVTGESTNIWLRKYDPDGYWAE